MKKNGGFDSDESGDDGRSSQPGSLQAAKLSGGGGFRVSDRRTHYCVMDLMVGLALEGMVATKEVPLRMQFAGKPRMRVAMEAVTHSG